MPDSPVSIFISYSRVDSAFVDRLEMDLRALQFQTWVDRRKLEGGQDWMDELQKAINQCQILLVVLSPDAAASEYVRMEYRYARQRGKMLIPLHHRTASDIPMDLYAIQWVDFLGAYEVGLQALVKSLQRVGAPKPAPAPPSANKQPDSSAPPKASPSSPAPLSAPTAESAEPGPERPGVALQRKWSAEEWLGATLQKRYTIERIVATGSVSVVYKGFDQRFNRACAIKVMLDNFSNEEDREQTLHRFEREANTLASLHHPAIPLVFDFFLEDGHACLLMEYVEGRTLAEVLEQEGQPRGLPEARVRGWAVQVCNFLACLHSQNPPILYRNLKPSKIMVTNADQVKVIDFSLARPFQAGSQATVIMTMGYAPPEQLEGKPIPQSDIYALGVTLHRLLSRHQAANNKPSIFDFPTIRSMRPEISPYFDALIGRALQKDQRARWASASEMEQAILRLPPL